IDVEVQTDGAYAYDIQCQVVGEDGTVSLPDPSAVVKRAGAACSFPIMTDWSQRFIEAYDIEFDAWAKALLNGAPDGPSAWEVLAVLSGYSFGQTTFLVNVVFVIGQFMLLGRKLPWWNIFQLAAVFVFSAFIDLSMFLIAALKPEAWGGQLLMSLAGNLFLALGIVLQISSKTLVQPGEGIVLAIAVRLQRSFGDIKVRSDIVLVCLAAILGFGCSRSFIGLREGTLISALLVGFLVKKIQGIDHKPAQLKEVSFQPNEKS
ncbi:DUF6198 family protein, partial [Sutterella wadsworthensis]|uniref:DUF6198 family protein n=1 Tax=Sutterella wadsworthensis TaxID=40545 RepID=UPI00307E0050